MKLKEIPQNTVVHTPTEDEVRELLAILHENGWTTYGCANYVIKNARGIQIESETDWSWWKKIENARKENVTILTLAEFKRLYCEPEKPQPKFKVGDKVIVKEDWAINTPLKVEKYDEADNMYKLEGLPIIWLDEAQLEPYTEPETKPTEDMEAKEKESGEKGNNPQNSQLDLCELLKGHEGIIIYSPLEGEVRLEGIRPKDNYMIKPIVTEGGAFCANGKWQERPNAVCCLFPSRALYEQYPLDSYTAWMKWQEEQTIYHIRIEFQPYDERGEMKCGNTGTLHFDDLKFRTPTDRDKCIGEIKAIIEKYSKE